MMTNRSRVAYVVVVVLVGIALSGCVFRRGSSSGGSGGGGGAPLPLPSFGGSGMRTFMGFSIKNFHPTQKLYWYVDGAANTWKGPVPTGFSQRLGEMHAAAGSPSAMPGRAPASPLYYTSHEPGHASHAYPPIAWNNTSARITKFTLHYRFGSGAWQTKDFETNHGCDTTTACTKLYYFVRLRAGINQAGTIAPDTTNGGYYFAKRGHQMMAPPGPPLPSDPGSACTSGNVCIWHHHNDCSCSSADGQNPTCSSCDSNLLK